MKTKFVGLSLLLAFLSVSPAFAKFIIQSVSGRVTLCNNPATLRANTEIPSTENASKFTLKFERTNNNIRFYDNRNGQAGGYRQWEITPRNAASLLLCITIRITTNGVVTMFPANSVRVNFMGYVPQKFTDPAPHIQPTSPPPTKKNEKEEELPWELVRSMPNTKEHSFEKAGK